VDKLAVSDRENHRIEFFDFDAHAGDKFDYTSTINMSAGGAKNGIFFEFSLCLSRACLGKMIVFIYKWLENAFFSQGCNAHATSVSSRTLQTPRWR